MKTKLGVTFFVFSVLSAVALIYMYIMSLQNWFESDLHVGYKYVGYPKWINFCLREFVLAAITVVIMVVLTYAVANNEKLSNLWLGMWMFCLLGTIILYQITDSSYIKQEYKSVITNICFAAFLCFMIIKKVPKVVSIVVACVVAFFRIQFLVQYVKALKNLPHYLKVTVGIYYRLGVICSQVIYPIAMGVTTVLFMVWMLFPEMFYKEKSEN